MNKGSFWVIDGIKIKKKSPFIFENKKHQQNFEKNINLMKMGSPHTGKSFQFQTHANQQYGKNFFIQKYQDIADNKFDYGMLKNNSVSSLRDFHLFGPPVPINQAPIPYNFEQMPNEPKKILFINQFQPFDYNIAVE